MEATVENQQQIITIREQLNAINSIDNIEDIHIAYDTLREILTNLIDENDLSVKLVNYQVISYLAKMLHRRHLTVIMDNYNAGVKSTNDKFCELFKSYMDDFSIHHNVQTRNANVFHTEIAFCNKNQKNQQPFISISIASDSSANLHDCSVIINAQQSAASITNDDDWYTLQNRIMLQRLIMTQCKNFDVFMPIIVNAIDIKHTLSKQQYEAESLIATLMEDFSTDMYEALSFIAEPTVDFCMRSILPRHDNQPGFELIKYRVSCEKIHNINVDTSITIFDNDGEVEVPDEFVRFESIRKRELQSFMQNKLAFITSEEFDCRFDSENTLHWLD